MSDGLVRTPDGVVHYAPNLALAHRCACGFTIGVLAIVPKQPVTCPTCWQAVAAT